MVLDNNPGATFRADANAALLALVTVSSGATEPPTKRAGMFWLDTSITPDGQLRMRNQANSAWVAPPGTIGSNMKRTIITTSQTWTKPPGLKWLDVIVIGGGGGTGAPPLTAAAQGSGYSGGGGGGVSTKLYAASALGATVSITVGPGGAVTPAAGSASIFGGQNGGGGGAGILLAAGVQGAAGGGAGGSASGGDVNIPGSAGGIAWRLLTAAYSTGGDGGSSALTNTLVGNITTTTAPGTVGTFPGCGARGGCNAASQAAAVGAVGGAGAVILIEYY
jgi:hypothetical protein